MERERERERENECGVRIVLHICILYLYQSIQLVEHKVQVLEVSFEDISVSIVVHDLH